RPTTSRPGQRRRHGLQSATTPKRCSPDACSTTAGRRRTILSRTTRISKTNSSDDPPTSQTYRFRQPERRRAPRFSLPTAQRPYSLVSLTVELLPAVIRRGLIGLTPRTENESLPPA